MSEAIIDTLKRARELLTKGWTKRVSARDDNRTPVSCLSEQACSWCALGAVEKSAKSAALGECDHFEQFDETINALSTTLNGSVIAFNDAQDRVEPVLELFDKTIARLENEGA
jgi:hypothetical protein